MNNDYLLKKCCLMTFGGDVFFFRCWNLIDCLNLFQYRSRCCIFQVPPFKNVMHEIRQCCTQKHTCIQCNLKPAMLHMFCIYKLATLFIAPLGI